MNVLIAGGFWAIAKFMVLLCCAIIFIIRAIYFYIKTCKKWRKLTKIFYVMTMVPLSASSIITLGGVSNIIKGDWVIKVFSMMIFGGFIGGWYVKNLLKDEKIDTQKWHPLIYKFKEYVGTCERLGLNFGFKEV